MAPRRRRAKRREELSPDQERWLRGELKYGLFEFALTDEEFRQFWFEHSARIVADHIEENPGTRPLRWWEYESPEPRKRLSGVGTPQHEVLGVLPCYQFGLPALWVEPWMPAYYRGIAKDIHGNPINEKAFGNEFDGVPIDPNDPPRFESQAAYLKRLGLLLPGEAKRLKKNDFIDEAIAI